MSSNNTSSSNYIQLQEPLICRICLENDELSNLIYPCKCNGNSKYVHKNCLNEWRTLSGESEHFTKCEICHYTYKFKSQIEENCTYKCVDSCSSDMCNGLFCTMFLTFIVGYITSLIDTNFIIPYKFGIEINNNNDNLPIFYLLFGAGIIISVEFILILIGLLMIKNKKLYCKIYCNNIKYISYVIILAFISFLVGGILIGILFLEYSSLFICQIHIKSLDGVYRENWLEIENYEDDV